MKVQFGRNILAAVFFVLAFYPSPMGYSASSGEVDEGIKRAIADLKTEVPGAAQILEEAKGVLVFPGLWKGGFGFGGEYGEGALTVKGQVVDYYSIMGGSFGFQLGL